MPLPNEHNPAADVSFTSSVDEDVWSGTKSGCEYEWWYFDALSDDASEAIVIFFLDNFVFSPRYNSACENIGADNNGSHPQTYPAVAFTYYRNGKAVCRAITEFDQEDFKAAGDTPVCRIGDSTFEFRSAPYGSGYAVNIDLPLPRNKRVRARLEWLSIESDLTPKPPGAMPGGHRRNLVAPRSDVTGHVTIIDARGKRKKQKFRGTGYHDHCSDTRWMPDAIDEWFWGRAHFPFATAVFCNHREIGTEPVSKLFLIRDRNAENIAAEFKFEETNRRDKFGLGFPGSFTVKGDGFEMVINRPRVIESSFFYLRAICHMKLSDGKHEWETSGIADYLKPEPLRSRWLRRLIDLRIGKAGKCAILP